MAINYNDIFFFLALPKYTKIVIFGLKIQHLATLSKKFFYRPYVGRQSFKL
jgi:hypothetical protein